MAFAAGKQSTAATVVEILLRTSLLSRRRSSGSFCGICLQTHSGIGKPLLVAVPETVWPAEVAMVMSEVNNAGELPVRHQRRLQHHINRMWLEKMPESETFLAASEPNPIASEQLGIVFMSIKPKV